MLDIDPGVAIAGGSFGVVAKLANASAMPSRLWPIVAASFPEMIAPSMLKLGLVVCWMENDRPLGVRGGGECVALRTELDRIGREGILANTFEASERGRRWPWRRPYCCWPVRGSSKFSRIWWSPLKFRGRPCSSRRGVRESGWEVRPWERHRKLGERGGDGICECISGWMISNALESSTMALAASSSTGGTAMSIASCGERLWLGCSMSRSKIFGSGDPRCIDPVGVSACERTREGVEGGWMPGCKPRLDVTGDRACAGK